MTTLFPPDWRARLRQQLPGRRTSGALVAGGLVLGAALSTGWFMSLEVPAFQTVQRAHVASEGRLLSREGEVLQTVRLDKTVQRDPWVPLSELPPAVVQRVLRAEDREFFSHGAVDWSAVGTSLFSNLLLSSGRRGASSLTMQTVDLLEGVRKGKEARTWSSKMRQAALAYRLEQAWAKEQILEAYLNEVTFRGELQGVGAASRFLFQKSPSSLSVDEASLLAVLVRSPSATPARVARRFVQLQESFGAKWSAEEAQTYITTALYRKEGFGVVGDAPHLAQRLVEAPYRSRAAGTPAAFEVASSIDAGLQRVINAVRDERILELRGRNAGDAAVVVLDNKTGQVLAYVGTSSLASTAQDVDTVQALRQSGSTLKPFIYGLALESRRLTAASLLVDEPFAQDNGAGVYAPQNYDKRYRGLVSVRTSLASSLNIPAVKALQIANPDAVNDRLRDLGLSVPQDSDFYGDGLALGSLDVTLLALTNAYRALANLGVVSPVCYLKDCATGGRRVMSAEAAWVIGNILSDNNARATTFGLNSVLRTPYWSAVKTGTSKDMRDNWALGFSSKYTVGVWVGNAKGDPMHDVSGVSGAAPLWRDVMDRLHVQVTSERPAAPPGVVAQMVVFHPAVEPPREEVFVAGTQHKTVEVADDAEQLASGQVTIRNPVNNSRLALDPEIPAGRQRVLFKASVDRDIVWRLDGKRLNGVSWTPTAGKHVLEALDLRKGGQGLVLDTSDFEVRASR